MADYLSTSGINSLVNSYYNNEVNKKIAPLSTKKDKYQGISTAYSTLTTSLTNLKSILSDLKATGSSSIFANKSTASSNSNFATISATNSAAISAYNIRLNQLAKSDMVLGKDLTSDDYSSVITTTGTHSLRIKTGDGESGEYYADVNVTFDEDDFDETGITNKTVMEKIRDAVNSDKAVVTSTAKSGSAAYSGGTASFNLDINGTETTITIESATDYNDLMDQLVAQINEEVDGVTAEKIVDSPSAGDVKLKLSVDDSTSYISISQESGFDLVSDLGIEVTKEKAASGIVVASVFSPLSSTSQLSFTAKNSGYNNRITELYESGGSNTALSSIGLNLGTTRTSFVQTDGGEDTPGFVYALSDLNSKFNFNGVDIERDSNEVSDLVTGATISLKSVMEETDATVSVSITNNVSSIKSKIESFITKFNEIYSYIRSKSTTDESGNRGIFIGDTNASSILSMFSSSAYGAVSGISSEEINTLSKLGITFNSASGLSISNSATLEQNLNEKIDEVEALFNSTNGIASTLYDKVSSYLGTSGYLTRAKKSVDESIEEINDSITSSQEKIEKSAESLRQRYIQMQMQLNSLYEVYNSISSM